LVKDDRQFRHMVNRILILSVLSAAMAPLAMACSCIQTGSAAEQMKSADFVFEGQVIDISPERDPRTTWQWLIGAPVDRQTITTFQVNQTLKGSPGRNIALKHWNSLQSERCGVSFRRQSVQIVLAYKQSNGFYGTSLCTLPQFPDQDYIDAVKEMAKD